MSFYYTKFVIQIATLSRSTKTFLLISSDYLVLTLSFWLSLSVRMNQYFFTANDEEKILILLAPILAVPVFFLFGLYNSMTRFSGYQSIRIIFIGVTIYTIFWFLLVLSTGIVNKPYDFLLINWLISIFLIGGTRILVRRILRVPDKSPKRAVIYGAGAAGVQLNSAIHYSPETKIIGFLDDNPKLHGLVIEGLKVYSPKDISKLIQKKSVTHVFLAISSLSRSERQIIIKSFSQYPLIIRLIPGLSDLAEGKLSISDLKEVRIEDLLAREIIEPNQELMKRDISEKHILVTGAGGSIGSELSRQILKLKPKLLILFDISEHSLYLLERKLLSKSVDCQINTVIGNVTNQSRLEKIIKTYKVDTIYHTAAYKHVPLVEKNTIAGVRCNIFGTLACCQAAINEKVTSFVFISTDKAVRPTNIMGATKRFAELILQGLAMFHSNNEDNNTRISIVRFGNVLGSSGSVVPLFREQIKKGGPVTVTDPNIIRYFMTIEEASQLVIQAGTMGINGEIFLLDMGEPIKVTDLAKNMISLSGMSLQDDSNPKGDIAITYTGLRPGEKLYEELLIDNKSENTAHKKIMKAQDKYLDWNTISKHLLDLENHIETEDYDAIKNVFLKCVDGYSPGKA